MSLWQKLNQPVTLKGKGDKPKAAAKPAAPTPAPAPKREVGAPSERAPRRSVWEKLNQPVGGKAKRATERKTEREPVAVSAQAEIAPEETAPVRAVSAEVASVAAPLAEIVEVEESQILVPVADAPVADAPVDEPHVWAPAAEPADGAPDTAADVESLSREPAPYEPPPLMDLIPTFAPDPEPVMEPEAAQEPEAQDAEAKPETRRRRASLSKPSLKAITSAQLSLPSLKSITSAQLSLPSLGFSRGRRTRSVIGLDIEPGAVRVVQARIDGGRLRVERAHSAPLDSGIVRDGEVVQAEELATVLRELFAEHNLDKRVRIGVANQRIVVRELIVPPIDDPKQLATAVTFLAVDELPMPIDQAVIDHVVLGPVETPEGTRLRVLLVAARRSMIDTVLAAVRAAGLKPEGIDLSAFALVRAVGRQPGRVLHLGVGGVVNLVVAHDGECAFTRVVAGGVESMAVELAERQSMEIDDARAAIYAVNLDRPAGGDDPRAADARTVLELGLRRIAGEVRNTLDFHFSGEAGATSAQAGGSDEADRSPAVERVVLSGPAIGIPGFADALGERLGLPVEAADVDGVDEADRGIYAVAAGLTVTEVRG